MNNARIIRGAGFVLFGLAVVYAVLFGYLAYQFDYPSLSGAAPEHVLTRLLSMGAIGTTVWTLFALAPLVLIPGTLGAYLALRRRSEGIMRLALLLSLTAGLALAVSLMRWPGLYPKFAEMFTHSEAWEKDIAVFYYQSAELYLGQYIGVFIGEISLFVVFMLTGLGMQQSQSFNSSSGKFGIAVGVLGLIGISRVLFPIMMPLEALVQALIPVWLVVLGVSLVRSRPDI